MFPTSAHLCNQLARSCLVSHIERLPLVVVPLRYLEHFGSHLRAVPQESAHEVDLAGSHGFRQRGVAVAVPFVRVGAALKEDFDDVAVAVPHGGQKRRRAAGRRRLNGPRRKQVLVVLVQLGLGSRVSSCSSVSPRL